MRRNPNGLGTILLLGLAGGGLWLATRKKKRPAKAPPPEPVEPVEEPPGVIVEPPEIPFVELRVAPAKDPIGVPTARFVSDDIRVSLIKRPPVATISISVLPLEVLVSIPESFEPSALVEAGEGNALIGGIPRKSRDFVFRIRQYARSFEDDDYSAFLTANFRTGPTSATSVPMRIYVMEPG